MFKFCAVMSMLLLVAACSKKPVGPPLEEVLAAERPKLKYVVDSLEKLAPKIAEAPLSPVKLDAEPMKFATTISDDRIPTNAALLYVDDIKVGWRGPPDYLMRNTDLLPDCYQLLKAGMLPPRTQSAVAEKPSGKWAKKIFDGCANVTYALVVLRERVPVKHEQNRQFSGGFESGSVVVYNLRSGKHLGGFSYNESVADEISASSNPEDTLNSEVAHAIEQKIAKDIPGATIIPFRDHAKEREAQQQAQPPEGK